MQAAILTGPSRVEVVDQPPPPPAGPGQARLAVLQCGLCAGEVAAWAGRAPADFPEAIGHEVAGVVTAVGEQVTGVRPGDLVAAWVPAGGFAEEILAEGRCCVPAAPGLRYPAVAEPLSCVVNAVELASPALADDVVIVGAGLMGALVLMTSMLKGPRSVVVTDVRPDALARAAELGGDRVHTCAPESLADTVQEVTDGRGADVSYEVTGVSAGLELAGQVTRMSGKLCIVGYHQGGSRAVPLADWNWRALRIVNGHFRDTTTIMAGMRSGMRLVNSGILDPSPLVTNWYPLDGIADAFQDASSRAAGYVKAVIEPMRHE